MGKAIVYTALIVVCLGIGALIAGLVVHYAGPESAPITQQSRNADCLLVPHKNQRSVGGRLRIRQLTNGNLTITGSITGLSAGGYGFHIHEYGLREDDCGTTGGHFNPFGKKHGAPWVEERHVGDLGNINSTSTANTEIEITDHLATLFGENSVIGRAIVVHTGADDLVSDPTGNAGNRLACCTIMHIPENQ